MDFLDVFSIKNRMGVKARIACVVSGMILGVLGMILNVVIAFKRDSLLRFVEAAILGIVGYAITLVIAFLIYTFGPSSMASGLSGTSLVGSNPTVTLVVSLVCILVVILWETGVLAKLSKPKNAEGDEASCTGVCGTCGSQCSDPSAMLEKLNKLNLEKLDQTANGKQSKKGKRR